MSDKPQGPGWWLASDGTWHPPELHPSEVVDATGEAPAGPKVPPARVPELTDTPTGHAESDHRPEAGPMYPDLFEQALAGNGLADVVKVTSVDGSPGSHDMLMATLQMNGSEDDSDMLVSASARTPAEIGAFTGASAKRRWRLHR